MSAHDVFCNPVHDPFVVKGCDSNFEIHIF